jgi:DeoR/GlpR family transcriptional regulator of sugar metabolism
VLRRLTAHGEVGFTGLAEEFGVSEMTIRRDLETLEADGLARRVRGGAISVVSRSYNDPDIRVLVTGGQVRNGELSLTGRRHRGEGSRRGRVPVGEVVAPP